MHDIYNDDINNIIIRKALYKDVFGICDILNYYIINTTASWRYEKVQRKVIKSWLKMHQNPQRPFWVAELYDKIIGYSCLSDFRNGEGYWPCAEISIYLQPKYCNKGIGGQLMKLIIREAQAAGLKAIIAGIDADNTSSIEFHQHYGFIQCGYLKDIGWKDNSWRSLVFLQLNL